MGHSSLFLFYSQPDGYEYVSIRIAKILLFICKRYLVKLNHYYNEWENSINSIIIKDICFSRQIRHIVRIDCGGKIVQLAQVDVQVSI